MNYIFKTCWLVLCFVFVSCGQEISSTEKVIYGDNGIVDISAASSKRWLNEFKSVALITEKSRLIKRFGANFLEEKAPTKAAICEKEPFENARNLGHCSGSLIEYDLLVTAKHCLEVVPDGCSGLAIVFDMTSHLPLKVSRPLGQSQLFTCKRVYQPTDPLSDLIMIRLDRPTNRSSLNFTETEDWLSIGELTVLGHPLGGDQKVASGGSFRKSFDNDQLLAELDVFEGNSGSPVFSNDKEVRGILLGGEVDFQTDPTGCLRVKRCPQGNCTGETMISSRSIKELHSQIERIERVSKLPQKVIFDGILFQEQAIPEPSANDSSPSLVAKFKIDDKVLLSEIHIHLDIIHSNLSDITFELISPSGKVIPLLDRVYKQSEEPLVFDFRSKVDSVLDSIIGYEASGEWQLTIRDLSELQSGRILTLTVEMKGAFP